MIRVTAAETATTISQMREVFSVEADFSAIGVVRAAVCEGGSARRFFFVGGLPLIRVVPKVGCHDGTALVGRQRVSRTSTATRPCRLHVIQPARAGPAGL